MKIIFHIFFLVLLAGEIVALYFVTKPKPQNKVLGESIVTTATPTASPTPEPTIASTPLASPKPSATAGVPQPKFTSQQINEFINKFSGQYGVSPDVMRHIAICESGFNPLARNSVYAGLFQFDATTWKNIRLQMKKDTNKDLRFNAEEAVQTAIYTIGVGGRGLWPHCYP